MSEHDTHDDDQGDALIRELQERIASVYHDADRVLMFEVLADICARCPDQELIPRIHDEKPGLTVFPAADGWNYVGVVGLDPDHPTRADVFGRFPPSAVQRPMPQG